MEIFLDLELHKIGDWKGDCLHRARTMHTPRNVLEQTNGKRSLLGSRENGTPRGAPMEASGLLAVTSGWLLLLPGGLYMVAAIAWRALDGCCYFLVGSGWLVLFLGGLWMVHRMIFNSRFLRFLPSFLQIPQGLGLERGTDYMCELRFGDLQCHIGCSRIAHTQRQR